MRLLTLIIISTLSCSFDKTTNFFEGQLIYKQSYKSDKLNTDSLLSNSANGSIYLINQRYYKGLTYSKDSAIYILDGTTGKSLHKTRRNKGFSCFDNTINNTEPATIIRSEKIEIINGFRCKSLDVTSIGGRSIYYYSIDHKLNPTVYSKHPKWNWKQLMEQANGGVTIKSIHFTDMYELIIELKSLKEFKIDNKEFEVKEADIEWGC